MDTIHPTSVTRLPLGRLPKHRLSSPLSYGLRFAQGCLRYTPAQTQVSALSSASLRPFSNQLAAYTRFSLMFRDVRAASKTLPALVRATKKNTGLRAARLAAWAELQSVYDHIAFGLRLPRIPLYLPLRKRVRVGGGVLHFGSVPKEIRLFPFWGVVKKQRRDWQPSEIGVTTPMAMCEILLHEVAHVHQLHFEHAGDHEHSFVRSYVAVEEVMLGFGFGPLLPQRLRLIGCPPGSYAASMQGTPRPQPTQPAN